MLKKYRKLMILIAMSSTHAFAENSFVVGTAWMHLNPDVNVGDVDSAHVSNSPALSLGIDFSDNYSVRWRRYDYDSEFMIVFDPDFDVKFQELGFISSYPLTNNLSIYGELGAIYWHSNYNGDWTSVKAEKRNDYGLDPLFGLGAKFDFSYSFSSYFEITRLKINPMH